MKRYLLVEGITDVALVKYICLVKGITKEFNDFLEHKNHYNFNDLVIINLEGQDKLKKELSFLKTEEQEILKIGILQDADNDFKKSEDEIKKEIKNSEIDESKITYFLTPNHKDLGDLETLLLSTLDKENIPQLKCFQFYKECLAQHIDIGTKAMDKAELHAYTMFAKDGKKMYIPKDSFMYKPNKKYNDTGLWDLSKKEFEPIINFVETVFK
ncbi:MAG: hypothetical protein KU29_07490 [Sulfurovum sp. FS06-10]|jgi:hypothetical protein|nr:MAG: hypothetical protein KU29_07490 [Sulfurovum sp. FS06-10]